MVEIYSYDITTHEKFARDQKEIEAFRKQYHVPPGGAGLVAIQTRILDFVPKHSAIVLLMQTYQRKLWARFVFPKNYYTQRFSSSYIAPSLGSYEKQDADIQRIESYLNQRTKGRFSRKEKQQDQEKEERERQEKNEEEILMEEGGILINLLEEGIKDTNRMVDFVISRMHQFVQA